MTKDCKLKAKELPFSQLLPTLVPLICYSVEGLESERRHIIRDRIRNRGLGLAMKRRVGGDTLAMTFVT